MVQGDREATCVQYFDNILWLMTKLQSSLRCTKTSYSFILIRSINDFSIIDLPLQWRLMLLNAKHILKISVLFM